jgi:hypothetical protein
MRDWSDKRFINRRSDLHLPILGCARRLNISMKVLPMVIEHVDDAVGDMNLDGDGDSVDLDVNALDNTVGLQGHGR